MNPGVNTDPNGYTCDGERWWGSNYGSPGVDAPDALDLLAPTMLPTTDITGAAGYLATLQGAGTPMSGSPKSSSWTATARTTPRCWRARQAPR